jgi:hypothetical protein
MCIAVSPSMREIPPSGQLLTCFKTPAARCHAHFSRLQGPNTHWGRSSAEPCGRSIREGGRRERQLHHTGVGLMHPLAAGRQAYTTNA